MTATKRRDMQILLRLLQQARPYWPHLGLLLLLSLAATPLVLLLPLPFAMVVDALSGADPVPAFLRGVLSADMIGSPMDLLIFAACFLIGLSLLDQLQKLGVSLLGTYTGERILLDFRARIFRHVQRLSLAYHDVKG